MPKQELNNEEEDINLISKTWRVRRDQDKRLKVEAKKRRLGSVGLLIREMIDNAYPPEKQ